MGLAIPLQLGQAFEKVFSKNDRLRELEQRNAQLEQYQTMQHAITHIIACSTQLENAIPRIVQAICETIGWDFGEVWHIDRQEQHLFCAASWHIPSLSFPAFSQSNLDLTFLYGKGLPGRAWANGKSTWITDVVIDANFLRGASAEQDGLHAGLGIPIRTEGEVIGVMTFFSRHIRSVERDLLRVLDTIGSQIGLFIERKRIEQLEHEQARKLATLEERQRLARDLHDSVTQTLFSASVIAEMLPRIWQHDPEETRLGLEDLHVLTRDALAEMRSLLVELRPSAYEDVDLREMLKNLADATASRSNLKIIVEVDGHTQLMSETKKMLFHITQEALNNVMKHAGATHVWITLCKGDHHLELNIRDNGCGFKMDRLLDGHFGLEIMRERAEEIGSMLRLNSIPGKGTQLTVIVPQKH
jgi:signal transduction histidine kinase